jgi:hypothetical protein
VWRADLILHVYTQTYLKFCSELGMF